jgi:hypothetical protein
MKKKMYYKYHNGHNGLNGGTPRVTPRRATTTSRRRATTTSRRRTTTPSRWKATMSRRRATMSRRTARRATMSRTTPNMLKTSLHFLFTYIAEIHKWDDNMDDVVDAYITMFKKSNVFKTGSSPSPSPSSSPSSSPSPSQSGGKFDFPFKKYATWLMHTAVGKFDSPCNILISSIALSTYAIMVYAFVQSMQKHNFDVAAATSDESYIYSLATPVKYALYHYFPSVHEFQEQIFVIFDEYIRQVFHSFSEQFSISVASQNPTKMIINLLRAIYYDGNLYNLFVVKPVSCILQYKIKSCKKLC